MSEIRLKDANGIRNLIGRSWLCSSSRTGKPSTTRRVRRCSSSLPTAKSHWLQPWPITTGMRTRKAGHLS